MVLNRLHTKRVNENRIIDQQNKGGFIIYSGVGIYNWYFLSTPEVDLE